MSNKLKTAEKLLLVLEMFSREKVEWGVTELSDSLNMSKTVIYRILNTLESHNYLFQNPENNKYRLGNKFIQLGEIARKNFNIVDLAEEHLFRLASRVEETVLMDVLDPLNNTSVCVEKIESSKEIKFTCNIGEQVPLYAGAFGKVILAWLSPEKIEEVLSENLKKYTPNTNTDPDSLREELKEIKESGYAITYGEWNPGGVSVASPVLDNQKQAVAAVGISGPEFRMTDKIENYCQLCRETAESISKNLR